MAYLKHAVRIVYTFHLQLELVITKKTMQLELLYINSEIIIFLCFSHGFPLVFHSFPNALPIVFLWFSYGSPMVFHSYPMVFP